jgi:hypothetical protein
MTVSSIVQNASNVLRSTVKGITLGGHDVKSKLGATPPLMYATTHRVGWGSFSCAYPHVAKNNADKIQYTFVTTQEGDPVLLLMLLLLLLFSLLLMLYIGDFDQTIVLFVVFRD